MVTIKTPAVAAELDVTMTDDTHDHAVVALVRAVAANWEEIRTRTEALRESAGDWGTNLAADSLTTFARCAVVEAVSLVVWDDEAPYSLAIDGRRFVVVPVLGESHAAWANLIVEDAATGERIAYCPGQWSSLPAVA